MSHLTLEAKEAILKQALENNGRSQVEIAKHNNIGYSTLQRWLKARREGRPLKSQQPASRRGVISRSQKFTHVLAAATLDESALGAYCREQGIYSHQLSEWKEDLMSESNNKNQKSQLDALRALKSENKALKKDLRRKEKALAESSALLVLKKKADLIWGDHDRAIGPKISRFSLTS